MPFNKGDFTQQGVAGHVNANLRLNEKRLVNIDLTSNENDEGCTISGTVTDLLNNVVYQVSKPTSPLDIFGVGAELVETKTVEGNLNDIGWASWTPSTTDTVLVPLQSDFLTIDRELGYNYVLVREAEVHYKYTEPTTALTTNLFTDVYGVNSMCGSLTDLQNGPPFTGSNKNTRGGQGFTRRYTVATDTYTNSYSMANYGIHFSSSLSPTVTSTTITYPFPAVSAVCDSGFNFTTTAAANVDPEASTLKFTYTVYKIPVEGTPEGVAMMNLYNKLLAEV